MIDTADHRPVSGCPGESAEDGERPTAMRLENVTRHFGRGGTRRVVLREVSFAVAPGTLTHIGGRNGAGKTTLLRLMAGILKPSAGKVVIGELSAETSWREFHRRVGFLSAGDRGLYARLSVRAHLEYWCALAFVRREQRAARIEESLRTFELADLSDRRSERLSQGQRQRLRLALALVHRPQILLLDEPRNSLDADGLALLASAMHAAVERTASVVWCSPPGEEQPVHFDRQLILDDAQLRPV